MGQHDGQLYRPQQYQYPYSYYNSPTSADVFAPNKTSANYHQILKTKSKNQMKFIMHSIYLTQLHFKQLQTNFTQTILLPLTVKTVELATLTAITPN